jgi:hypothetical protein
MADDRQANELPTTGTRIRTLHSTQAEAGRLGTIVSGPTARKIFRVQLDELEHEGERGVMWLFAREFEVIPT